MAIDRWQTLMCWDTHFSKPCKGPKEAKRCCGLLAPCQSDSKPLSLIGDAFANFFLAFPKGLENHFSAQLSSTLGLCQG